MIFTAIALLHRRSRFDGVRLYAVFLLGSAFTIAPLSGEPPASASKGGVWPGGGTSDWVFSGGDTAKVAHLRFLAEGTARNAAAARSAAELNARTTLASLRQSGVDLLQLELGGAEVVEILERPRVPTGRRPPPSPRVLGYRAWIPIIVRTPAVDRVEFLIDHARAAGATLDSVSYFPEGKDGGGGPET